MAGNAYAASLTTLHKREQQQRRTIRQDQGTIRFFKNHPRLAKTKTGRKVIRFAKAELAWTKRELGQTHQEKVSKLRQRQAAAWPPHHQLWLCISKGEGGVTSVNHNGHYGMLQMSYNWLGYIRGRASDYSQQVQEWAAERAYRANGYSTAFLYGQWFDYDGRAGACLGYAK